MASSHYDKDLTALGVKVVIKKLEKWHVRDTGGIVIPESFDANQRMTMGEVISVGKWAEQENIKVGMKVLYDTMSVFKDTYPNVVVDVPNVIVVVNDEDDIPLTPLGNNILLERIEMNNGYGGIILPEVAMEKETGREFKYKVLKLGLGKVNLQNGYTYPFPVEVGQYIIPNKEVDLSFTTIMYKNKNYFMLDAVNVVATIEE